MILFEAIVLSDAGQAIVYDAFVLRDAKAGYRFIGASSACSEST